MIQHVLRGRIGPARYSREARQENWINRTAGRMLAQEGIRQRTRTAQAVLIVGNRQADPHPHLGHGDSRLLGRIARERTGVAQRIECSVVPEHRQRDGKGLHGVGAGR